MTAHRTTPDALEPGRRASDGAWTTALDETFTRLVVHEAASGAAVVSVEGGSSGALPQGTVVYAYDRANAARAIAGDKYVVVKRDESGSGEGQRATDDVRLLVGGVGTEYHDGHDVLNARDRTAERIASGWRLTPPIPGDPQATRGPVSPAERAAAQRARDTADRKRAGREPLTAREKRIRDECRWVTGVEPITDRDWGRLLFARAILNILGDRP